MTGGPQDRGGVAYAGRPLGCRHDGLTLLEAEVTRELPIPAWGFGVIAFVLLLAMLMLTLSIGKGRPHS